MNIFFNSKVTGHVDPEKQQIHGTIIDNLSDYSDYMEDKTDKDRDTGSWRNEYLRMPAEFIKKFPNLPINKAEKYYNQYLQRLREIWLRRLPFLNSNYAYVSLNRLWDMEFRYEGKRYYIWKEFKDLRPFFVEIPEKKGNGRKGVDSYQKNSEVYIMNQKLLDLLIDTADAKELVTIYYGEIDTDTKLESVPINIKSLNNFIKRTTKELEVCDKNTKLEATLYKNLRQAKYIKIISEFFYDPAVGHTLPLIQNPSPYGRMYYKGINIQNVTKEVRSACLGDHHVYDLNAAVYAIKLYLVTEILKQSNIDDFGHFVYTKDYLEWKEPIRKKLAMHVKSNRMGEKLVKEAITAIGFGARVGAGSWQIDGIWQTPAIEDILMNPQDRYRFVNDPWVKQFVREQQVMTKLISDYYISQPDFMQKIEHIPNMFKNNKPRRTQVMSYVFQQCEKMIMDEITQFAPVIARIHDCFITKNQLSVDQILTIKQHLSQYHKLLTISHEEAQGWLSDEVDDESDIDEAFSKLTGVQHTRPKIVLPKVYTKHTEGHYDSVTDYGNTEYDPEHDEMVRYMNYKQRQEHYRIIGHNPNKLPPEIERLLQKNK